VAHAGEGVKGGAEVVLRGARHVKTKERKTSTRHLHFPTRHSVRTMRVIFAYSEIIVDCECVL